MKMESFVCDLEKCDKKITIEKGAGFPYDKGWTYIYNFKRKFAVKEGALSNRMKDLEIKDKHFCGVKHELEFIAGKIEREATV